MQTLLLSLALLGQSGLDPDEMIRDLQNQNARDRTARDTQAQQDFAQRSIAYDDREAERQNTYIIAGAIVGGLILFGLLARGGKKSTSPPRPDAPCS